MAADGPVVLELADGQTQASYYDFIIDASGRQQLAGPPAWRRTNDRKTNSWPWSPATYGKADS